MRFSNDILGNLTAPSHTSCTGTVNCHSTPQLFNMTESTNQPLFGLWQPRPLKALYYGPDVVKKHLISSLPSEQSKAFILTGSSLANKTPLVKEVESLLGSRHASTFSDIKQHAPVADLDRATELALKDDKIDTIISIGGGSPIDSAKAISYRAHEKSGKYLYHITIPTTLSVAECTCKLHA